MKSLKTQMVKAKRKRQLKRKCQPWFQKFQNENNLLEQSWGYSVAQKTHKKNKISSALQLLNIRNSSVSFRNTLLLKFFYLKTLRKCKYLYKFPFQKIVAGVNWGHVKVSYLLQDLIPDKRTAQWKETFCVHC